MICRRCYGKGTLTMQTVTETPPRFFYTYYCPDCGGSGIVHCCDGLVCNGGEPEESGDDDVPLQ